MKVYVDISNGMSGSVNYITFKGKRYTDHSEVEALNKAGSSMSAELSYKDRLIKAYEEEISKEKQTQIKKFIFSEDNR